MGIRKRLFLLMGGAYRLIYRVPVYGERLVRSIARALGFLSSYNPYGLKRRDTMDQFRQDLERLFEMTDMDIEEIRQDGESIELVLVKCPYGYRRPEHAGVCDAAMDMDRTMFGRCGCDLTIEARLPHSDPACRVIISRKAASPSR
jgi:hypothetical protein